MKVLFHYRTAVLVHHTKRLNEVILVLIRKKPGEAYFDSVYSRNKEGLQQGEKVFFQFWFSLFLRFFVIKK